MIEWSERKFTKRQRDQGGYRKGGENRGTQRSERKGHSGRVERHPHNRVLREVFLDRAK